MHGHLQPACSPAAGCIVPVTPRQVARLALESVVQGSPPAPWCTVGRVELPVTRFLAPTMPLPEGADAVFHNVVVRRTTDGQYNSSGAVAEACRELMCLQCTDRQQRSKCQVGYGGLEGGLVPTASSRTEVFIIICCTNNPVRRFGTGGVASQQLVLQPEGI